MAEGINKNFEFFLLIRVESLRLGTLCALLSIPQYGTFPSTIINAGSIIGERSQRDSVSRFAKTVENAASTRRCCPCV